jgi:glucose/arabinose dehydrogenase
MVHLGAGRRRQEAGGGYPRGVRRLAAAVATIGAAAVVGAAVAGAAATPRLVPVARGFVTPVFATQAPGQPGRIYVVEQAGRIRVVQNGRVQATPFLDIRSRVVAGGEQGLLGLAFAADFARTGVFYVNYTAAGGGANTVARYRARNGRGLASTAQVVLSIPDPYGNHNGGHVAFGPDGRLWVGTGDGGAGGDPEDRAQDMESLLGKMLRLDVSRAQPTPEIVGLGLRNPWRYSFDRRTGDLWIGDVGQGAIEEIDRLPRSFSGLANFGWDVYEGTARYEDKTLGPGTLVQPVAQYTHAQGCSVTGGYVYRGKAVPRLQGRYVYGDYCSGRIWSIPATGGTPRVEPTRVEGLSSFGESLAGELYVVSHSGTIYRFVR